ncbi:Mucin 17-like protein [Mycoavidus cysteinexigens]|uniref:Mucin 17-like protein n=1 Tax=Mycoavidus cysteinexigens TaxID=1553431 RepID=A0A2Z6EVL5_9BURK|nr:hypothetical protein [Mycoavidus cysteinexigens]BBE09135.1 Mucin 17-like protein [Mycoavidus cysteinexigens]GLR00201.1 hypothetical protein GCM10007934_00120 [Mycoavidus cysteinexigens]
MGAVESVLRDVEKVTIRPLGEVARTVEREAIRPLGEVARDVERVTIKPLGQVIRGTERVVLRPTTEFVKESILLMGRTLDLVKPDVDIPTNTDVQAMEAQLRERAKEAFNNTEEEYLKSQGNLNEKISQTPASEAEKLNILGRTYELNAKIRDKAKEIINQEKAILNNQALTREYYALSSEMRELENRANALVNDQ